MTGRIKSLRAALPVLVVGFASQALPLHAQVGDTVSRAVVQPLPPAASDDLNEALMRLARDRRDVDALISAGLASLKLDDIDAAIGFFGRAKELSPENARIAEGMGAAYVRSGRPVEALNFFEEAEKAGINTGSLWADRGLAYDLVGQNQAAQAAYQRALSIKDDGAIRQRLALSFAISGQRQTFEDTLKPLLDARDFAAYRTRAFGLAMLGDADEAIEIARAVMPRDLAGRMEPYLRFMPRLTKSQQAAAANLGIYPSASRIGRDDPRIASAAGAVGGPQTSDTALEPRGEALGNAQGAQVADAGQSREQRGRAGRRQGRQGAASESAPTQPGEVRLARGTRVQEPPTAETPPPPQPSALPRPTQSEVVQLAAVDMGQPESRQDAPVAFDLANAAPAREASTAPQPQPQPQAQPPAQAATPAVAAATTSAPMDLATAFADFAEPTTVAVTAGDVVDISAIRPPREKEEEAAPPPPPAPARIWVQVGIGQNRTLLRSDWRLKYRKIDALKDKGPFVTSWGQTNRLLAGPFDSQADARAALNALVAADYEGFVWTSAAGQQIDELR